MIGEISIIIPTLNEEHYLPKLLDSIVAQKYAGRMQVVIVDGGSEDKTAIVAKSYKSKLSDLQFFVTRKDIATQRNFGVTKAKYKYLLFIDADVVLPKGCLRVLFKKVKPSERLLVSLMQWPSGRDVFDCLAVLFALPVFLLIMSLEPILNGAFVLTTKKNHESINGFKKGLALGEDIDYGKRSVKHGTKFQFLLYPYVFHSPRRARKHGRLGLLFLWLVSYLYMKKNGLIYDKKKFNYTFGDHEDI